MMNCLGRSHNGGCKTDSEEEGFQPFPKGGQLFENMDLGREQLLKKIGYLGSSQEEVIGYVIDTVGKEDMHNEVWFRQYGCSPNWQGDLITLCACKWEWRSFQDARRGKNKKGKPLWLAGFSSVKATPGEHALIFLARVEKVFPSQCEMFWALEQAGIARCKSASHSFFGDVYEPKFKKNSRNWQQQAYDSNYYRAPTEHVHFSNDGWRYDIEADFNGKYPAMLWFDPQYSFLWQQPKLVLESETLQFRGVRRTMFKNVMHLVSSMLQPI